MKHSPEDSDLYKNFKPSKFSGNGFLGDDERTVKEIISGDERILKALGVSREKIANSLADVYDKAVNFQGQIIEIGSGKTAVYHESRGSIPSPFRGDGTFEKGEVVLFDKTSGKELIITSLSIHLIRKHGFFQGKGSRFRVDPITAVEMLNLHPPGKDI